MVDQIRYFSYQGQIFELSPFNLSSQKFIKDYASFNIDSNPLILSDSEILSQLKENRKNQALEDFAQIVKILQYVAKAPAVRYSHERYLNDHWKPMHQKLDNCPMVGLLSQSTRLIDDRADKKKSFEERMEGRQTRIQNAILYAKIWGANLEAAQKKYAPFLSKQFVYMPITANPFFHPANTPLIKRVIFQEMDGTPREEFYLSGASDQLAYTSGNYPADVLIPALALIDRFYNEITLASEIIHKHHPDLHQANIANLLAASIIEEMVNLQWEDFLQDAEVCSAFECAMENRMREMAGDDYPKAKRVAWKFVNVWYSRNRQSYGPGQTILGTAAEASWDKNLLKGYSPYLKPNDFKEPGDILKALLDPAKLVYVKALTLDFIIQQLKASFYNKDTEIALPIDGPCPLSHRQTARELSLLLVARQYQLVPEMSILHPSLITSLAEPYSTVSFFFQHLATLAGFKQELPGFNIGIAPYTTWFGLLTIDTRFEEHYGEKLKPDSLVFYLDCQ